MAKREKRACPTANNRVGGQAVLEGVMMKHKDFCATAVRCPDKTIAVDKRQVKSIKDKCFLFRLPIIRGVVNFVETLRLSMSTLTLSAELQGIEEEKSEFEKKLEKKLGKSIMGIAAVIGGILGVVVALAMFFYLPMLVSKFVSLFVDMNFVLKAIVEGVSKFSIFLLYVWAVAFMPDIRRTYEYHGAEHKSIFCHEQGLPLTVENVKKQSRFHPRCGTSLMFVMLLIGMLVSMCLPATLWDNLFVRFLVKLLILPLVVGVGYEFTIFAGTHDNFVLRILTAPGLWFQRLTTREPDARQIEVAIVALKSAMPHVYPEESVFDNIENKKDEGEL
ncbi:MAG: DUF1385 domain-containing protein [Ruminococcaceae bacterium]|nr:DUF1385 domain-containing protein [Oscillospiraceae bacterium]